MKRIVMVALLLLVCLSSSALAQNLKAYDNFNGTFINPSKWSTFPGGCPSFSVLECVRAIQNGQLRLAVRGYGATSSNQGSQFGASELHFINPTPIKTIST